MTVRPARSTVLALAAAAATAALLGPGATAHADAAGPTDYRSEVVSIEPATPTIEVWIEGGDSFVVLEATTGTEVVVLGYEGEPYLRFEPDGTVLRNERSPATYANDDRYGSDVPDSAAADAEPEWVVVGHDGRYAWHDHRAHRMERFAPVNVERGDAVLDGIVPLQVDGRPVDVRITSTWQAAPSPWPAVAGAVTGVALGVAAWWLARTRRTVAPVLVPLAVAATVIGYWQYRSLPGETGPSITWWLLPGVASAFAVASVVVPPGPVRWAVSAIAGLQLALWSWGRVDGLRRAVLPTDAPWWLDRFVTAATLPASVVVAAVAVVALVRVPARSPRRSPA